jgi:tetratricopeptide (TPR) repeat protein
MKAERRHELQHNELADWVAEVFERLKPYSRAIAGVAVAAAVLLTAYVVLSSRAERKQSTAWTDYYAAIQAPQDSIEAELESVSRDHDNVPAGRWAEVALADLKLGEGINLLFKDKAAAEKKLKSAISHYEAVIPNADDPLLVARARFGLARAYESLGQLDEAKTTYEEIVRASGTNAYVTIAKSRLEDLNRESTQEFYAWFAKQEPIPVPDTPLPGTPGEKMPFDAGSFSTPGSLNLSGKNSFSVPTNDNVGSGPLLTPETPAAEDNKGSKDEKKDETGEQDTVKEEAARTPGEESSKGNNDAEKEKSTQNPDASKTNGKEPLPSDTAGTDDKKEKSAASSSAKTTDAKTGETKDETPK